MLACLHVSGPNGSVTVEVIDIEGHRVIVRNIALDPGKVESAGTYRYKQ